MPPLLIESRLRAAIVDYARNPNGNESLHAECLRLASQLSDCIRVASDLDMDSILSYAVHHIIPDDVCFVLIAKGYKTTAYIITHYYASLALIAAVLASHTHLYKNGKVVLTFYSFRTLFFRDDDVFDLFAKWGRIVMDDSYTDPLGLALHLRAERRLYNAGQILTNRTYTEEHTPKSFPRLRLLRLLPDYDNFVNVIVSWRRGSKYDIAGIERMIWRCLVGNLKF